MRIVETWDSSWRYQFQRRSENLESPARFQIFVFGVLVVKTLQNLAIVHVLIDWNSQI